MKSGFLRWLLVVGAFLALPVVGYAQEATLNGTVTDVTGGVLPGVTVTAVNEASGNIFVVVTDATGAYSLPIRVGNYRLSAELGGFNTVERTGVQLLLGQQATVDFQMSLVGVEETVTVTGEAPLLDTTGSRASSNVDQLQVSELPVLGRNWIDLTILAPGSRTNAVAGDRPIGHGGFSGGAPGGAQGNYQINVDGQQVTNNLCCGTIHGNPQYSRDAIAEFEFITNRFDATQGRSGIAQVNAITKSGTNNFSGTVASYFRDDRFNSADFVRKAVLPYSSQQVSLTAGGPIRLDRVHFFGYYEYEREPQTNSWITPFPAFNVDLQGTRRKTTAGARLDFQKSASTRFAVRANGSKHFVPFVRNGSATTHPAGSGFDNTYSWQVLGTLTQVLGPTSQMLNEIKVGYVPIWWNADSILTSPNWHPEVDVRAGGGPRVTMLGFAISPVSPQTLGTGPISIRDDFTFSFNKGGRHDVKTGAEYLYNHVFLDWCHNCNPRITANLGPVPANIEELFPVWNDASTWNLAAISPITKRYRQSIGTYIYEDNRHMLGFWVQDNWAVTQNLTLNLGLRYDPEWGGLGEKDRVPPFMSGNRSPDLNNLAPRLGAVLQLNDMTVVRGGWGLYFGEVEQRAGEQAKINYLVRIPETDNDGRPDFAANPHNGPRPSFDEIERRLCPNNPAPDCIRHDLTSAIPSPNYKVPYSQQASFGVQRQVGNSMAINVDYQWTATRADQLVRNMNLSYDPATGANYPSRDLSRRPFPDWGVVRMLLSQGRSDFQGVTASFTKRMSNGWQAAGTYTLGSMWSELPVPNKLELTQDDSREVPIGFAVAKDLGGDRTLAVTDQRHRASLNGIWDVGYGFQLSGLYFFSSGLRYPTNYGGDLRNMGGGAEARLRPDGTIVPRNDFVGDPVHRVDLRVQRRFPLGGPAAVDGILEVFNVFNHANFGSYTTRESSKSYGQPSFNSNQAYGPRMLQLGFRISF